MDKTIGGRTAKCVRAKWTVCRCVLLSLSQKNEKQLYIGRQKHFQWTNQFHSRMTMNQMHFSIFIILYGVRLYVFVTIRNEMAIKYLLKPWSVQTLQTDTSFGPVCVCAINVEQALTELRVVFRCAVRISHGNWIVDINIDRIFTFFLGGTYLERALHLLEFRFWYSIALSLSVLHSLCLTWKSIGA